MSHRIEGLIVAPVNDDSRRNLSPLMRRGLPFVLIDRAVPGIDSDLVQADSAAGARRLMEHLTGIGHQRIAFIVGSDDVSTTRERARGYARGLPPPAYHSKRILSCRRPSIASAATAPCSRSCD